MQLSMYRDFDLRHFSANNLRKQLKRVASGTSLDTAPSLKSVSRSDIGGIDILPAESLTKRDMSIEEDMSSLSTVESEPWEPSKASSSVDEGNLFGDQFLAQCGTSQSTSSSDVDEEETVSGSPICYNFLGKDADEDLSNSMSLLSPLSSSKQDHDEASPLGISRSRQLPPSMLAHVAKIAKENDYKHIEIARRAHRNLTRREKMYEDLKLTSRKKSNENQAESSFFGIFFHKMRGWSKDKKILDEEQPEEKSEDLEENNETTYIKESDVLQKNEDNTPELGLERSSIARLENYDHDLRKRAQKSIMNGKRNVAFVDKVEVLEIHARSILPKIVKHRMFYTRSQFQRMIATNMKEIELEMRRRQKKKAKKQLLRTQTS